MWIYVVSAEIQENIWRAIKAFTIEEEADEYAYKIYTDGCVNNQRVLDSRVDEINLVD